ncbi:MAG: hypothetical protein QM767_16810 [Anaeromyxobacter sp.]
MRALALLPLWLTFAAAQENGPVRPVLPLTPACEAWGDQAELELATLEILARRAEARGVWARLHALYAACPEAYRGAADEYLAEVPALLLARHWPRLDELGPLAEEHPDWLEVLLGHLARVEDPALPRRAARNAAACAVTTPLCAQVEQGALAAAAAIEARQRSVDVEARRRFAGEVRAVVARGDVEAFIGLLASGGLTCGGDTVPAAEVAEALRGREGVHALLFDTRALRTSARSRLPLYSYREFFQVAKDAVPVIPPGSDVIRWTSALLGEVAEPPFLGVVREGGRLRIGLVGAGCR